MFFLSTYNLVAQNKFVGVKSCGTCHKKAKIGKQLKIWKESSHANAYKTLQTDEANKIALDKGFKTKAVDTPECLKCHTTGFGIDKAMFKKKFKIEDGVQCESCHGAGSKYKKKKIMKDQVKAVAKGLTEYKDEASIEKQCRTCHNKEESPTFKEFNFKKRWKEIAHPIPTKG
ncbi:MAG: cytochrome C554 [Ignavibacteriae bacterium]|nr:cytochrome C554 [Ignavibacteriota bacterium]